jgi:hypothetical protein
MLIILIGLAILFAGIFPTDPDNRRDTMSGKIHASAVISLLLLLSAAPFTFSVSALYRNPPEEWFFLFSSWMGILVLAFLVISSIDITRLLAVLFQRPGTGFGRNRQLWLGLQQRLLLSLHYIWWFVFTQVLTDEDVLHSSAAAVRILQS